MKKKLTGSPLYVCPQARAAFGWGWGGAVHITVRTATGGDHRTPQVRFHPLSNEEDVPLYAPRGTRGWWNITRVRVF